MTIINLESLKLFLSCYSVGSFWPFGVDFNSFFTFWIFAHFWPPYITIFDPFNHLSPFSDFLAILTILKSQ